MESGKRSTILIWACVGAAAAGIVAVAALSRLRNQGMHQGTITHLRDVQDVLTDCYRKIQEIEDHLPDLLSDQSRDGMALSVGRSASNGSPVQLS